MVKVGGRGERDKDHSQLYSALFTLYPAVLKPPCTTILGKILTHPPLFAAWPRVAQEIGSALQQHSSIMY